MSPNTIYFSQRSLHLTVNYVSREHCRTLIKNARICKTLCIRETIPVLDTETLYISMESSYFFLLTEL